MNNSTSTIFIGIIIISAAKFVLGFITLILYSIVLTCLPYCLSIKRPSRMFLMTLCALNFMYFIFLTFYSPMVGFGVIPTPTEGVVVKIISTAFLFPIYSLHYLQTVMATDRLVAIRFSTKYDCVFSPLRTKLLIVSVILYGLAFSLPSFLHCCFTIFNPSKQVWLYPNDSPNHYRQYFGLISNYGNSIISGLIYFMVMHYLHKLK